MVCSVFDCSISDIKMCCLHLLCFSGSTCFFPLDSFHCRNPAWRDSHWRSGGLEVHACQLFLSDVVLPQLWDCKARLKEPNRPPWFLVGRENNIEKSFFISEQVIILLLFSCHSIRFSGRGKGLFVPYTSTFTLVRNNLGWSKEQIMVS